MFRSRRTKVSLLASFSGALLLLSASAFGQQFNVTEIEKVAFKGASQTIQLVSATGTNLSYSTDNGMFDGATAGKTSASDESGFVTPVATRQTINTTLDDGKTSFALTVDGDSSTKTDVTSENLSSERKITKIVLVCKGTISATGTCSGPKLTSDQYTANKSGGYYTTITVVESVIGTVSGDTASFEVTYEYKNETVDETGPALSSGGTFNYALQSSASPAAMSGLTVQYASDEEYGEAGKNDDYYTTDASKPPKLVVSSAARIGKYAFDYNVASSGVEGGDTITYTILVVNSHVWETTAATVSITENSADLTAINAQLRKDRSVDGAAGSSRKIEYRLKQGSADFSVDLKSGDTSVGEPVLSLKSKTGLNYEHPTRGATRTVEICAKQGTYVQSEQCYTLTVKVQNANDAPKAPTSVGSVIALAPDLTAPSGVLLTDDFSDADGDTLTFSVSPSSITLDTIKISASIVGKTVLSFTKSGGGQGTAGIYDGEFTVTATDPSGKSASAPFSFRTKVGANTPPIWNGGASVVNWSVAEGGTSGKFVSGQATASDVDRDQNGNSDKLSYSLSGGAFPIRGGVWAGACLVTLPAFPGRIYVAISRSCAGFDYEASSKWTVQMVASDEWGGKTDPLTIHISVRNVNEGPSLSGIPTQRLYKGTKSTVDVAASAKDPEGDAITLTCTSQDTAVVSVNPSCGSGAVLNPKSAGSTTITVVASNAAGTVQRTFNVIVKGGADNNPPAFASGIEAVAYTINENHRGGSAVGQHIGVSDDDEGDTIRLEVIPTSSKFDAALKSNTDGSQYVELFLKKGRSVDHEGGDDPTNFIVRADDYWEGRDYLRVTINVADVNEAPTRTSVANPSVSVVEDSTAEVDVAALFTDEDEIDSGRLSITALVLNPFVADVVVNAQGMAVVTGNEPGSTDVSLSARDSAGHVVTGMMSVTVTTNNPPVVANAIDDMAISVSEIVTIDVSQVFSDADGTTVMVDGVDVSDENVVLAVLTDSNSSLAVIGRAAGTADVTVRASDSSKAMVSDTFTVTVSEAASSSLPQIVKELGDMTITADVEETLNMNDVFEGDSLTFRSMVTDSSIVKTSLVDGNLSLMGIDVGSADVSVIATNGIGRSAIATFAVHVETMPTAVGTLPAVVLEVGADTFLVEFGDAFIDRDGDPLSYEVSVDDGNFVDWRTVNTTMWITPISRGTADVTIVASDPKGRSATQTFALEVGDSQIRQVAEQSLAGFGRAMLTSVTDAISSRVTSDTNSTDIKTSFKSWIQSLAQRASSGNQLDSGVTATSLLSTSSTAGSTDLNLTVPQSFSFSFGDGGKGSWSVWSHTDSQSIDGEGYDVASNSLYLGVDMKASEKISLGLAVSRNSGDSDFRLGTASRSMNNELTTVIPYISYAPTDKSQVWSMVGVGRGQTEITGGLDNDNSNLNMNLLSVGGRHQLASNGQWSLAVRGDYSTAQLSTDSGADLSSDLNASVNRVRAGLEGALDLQTSYGTVTPFADVGLRRDGGTDISGTGLEVAGGVRFAMKTFNLEAKGRTLINHSAQNYSEDGFSIRATMNPTGDGSGISFSIAPRWGNAEMTNTMFDSQSNVFQNSLAGVTGDRAIAARVGYGLLVSNDSFLVTPFVDYDQSNADRTKVLLGTTLVSSKISSLQVEFAVGSVEEARQGQKEAVAGIEASLRF